MGSVKCHKHPLDQLDAEEIKKAIEVVRKEKQLNRVKHRFLAVDLIEPAKSFVLAYENGQDFERKATMSICNDEEKYLYEAVVDLCKGTVVSWTHIGEGQPAILADECFEVEEAVKKSDMFREALKRRGIDNTDLVWAEPWSVGKYDLPYEKPGRRLMMAICFLQSHADDNGYAHPIDGLIPIVDLHEMKVIHVDEFQPTLPIPKMCFEYEKKNVCKTFRTDLKPLLLSQPDGTSFTVAGNDVSWQKWSFHVGFTAREGVVFHNIKYNDNGKWRSILYRAALCEMVVPYGDPRPQHNRKNAFDVGDYGIGRCANSLKKGCDCFGEVHYFDAYLNDSKGNVFCIPNAICMHEEDHGILWKHTNWRTGEGETRRSRRLVVSFFATVLNYEYGYYWYFYLDGSMEFEVKLSGVINVGAILDNETPKHGALIAPNLYAPIHQHFFNVRLDLAIDGVKNSVYEVNLEAEKEGTHNPQNNGNSNSINQHTGQPVAYRLESHGNAYPFARPNASVTKRAGFMKNHVWVTQYDSEQMYAAGKYPNQHPGGDGLEKWTDGNKSIVDHDIVLWYTLGILHMPRCEDFPVMPVATTNFVLKPDGFFTMNPANDVPPACKSGKD